MSTEIRKPGKITLCTNNYMKVFLFLALLTSIDPDIDTIHIYFFASLFTSLKILSSHMHPPSSFYPTCNKKDVDRTNESKHILLIILKASI